MIGSSVNDFRFIHRSTEQGNRGAPVKHRQRFHADGQAPTGSCPIPWCSSDVVVVLFGRAGRFCQAAMVGSLTKGSSLRGAMVSSVT